jgi:LacI family transcriptional regulator
MPDDLPRVALVIEGHHEGYRLAFFNGLQRHLADAPDFELATFWGSPFVTTAELAEVRPDAVIVMLQEAEAEYYRSLAVPVLNIGSVGEDFGLPTVRGDNHLAGRRAAAHLHERGFRHFGFVTMDRVHCEQRRAGFNQAVEEAGGGAPVPFLAIEQDRSAWARNRAAMRAWITALPHPSGIGACDDPTARLLVEAMRDTGLSVPGDVAVIGIGGDTYEPVLASPHLSSVPFDAETIGRLCAQRIAAKLRGEPWPDATDIVPPLAVVVRASTSVNVFSDDRINRVLRLLRTRAAEGIDVAALCRTERISRRNLDALMLRLTGRTAFGQLQWVRLEAAKPLLLHTEASVEAIAHTVGLGEARALTRLFHTHEGLAPGAWREQARSGSGLRRVVHRPRA